MMKQRRPTIYASDSRVGHLGAAGDLHGGRAWRAVRRPSDMVSVSRLGIILVSDPPLCYRMNIPSRFARSANKKRLLISKERFSSKVVFPDESEFKL
jgi:hypothetical protein